MIMKIKKLLLICLVLVFNINYSQTICQTIGQDSSVLYANGYVIGPENINCGEGIHTESKWIFVTGSESLNITTYQHRLYDRSRIYDQNNILIWEWSGESVPETTWYSKDHFVNVAGNDMVRIEFYQGYASPFCNGYMKVTKMNCSNLSTAFNEIVNQNQFKVYPNPFNNEININHLEETEFTVKFLNVLGQELKTIKLDGDNNRISLSNLLNGMYIMNFYDANNKLTYSKKIIKN